MTKQSKIKNTKFIHFCLQSLFAGLITLGYLKGAFAALAITSETDILQDTVPVSVSQRQFGSGDCRLTRLEAYRSPKGLTFKYDASKCTRVYGSPIFLVSPNGRFENTAITGVETERAFGGGSDYVVRRQFIFMQHATQISHSDEDIAASGLFSSFCVSFFCLRDNEQIAAIEQRKLTSITNQAASSLRSSTGDIKHPLLLDPPNGPTKIVHTFDGAIREFDWYVAGLKLIEAKQPSLKSDFSKYLASRYSYAYQTEFSSPFDKADFEKALADERQTFVQNLIGESTQRLPERLTSFTPVSIGEYDQGSGLLTIAICYDYINNNYPAISCGGAAGLLPIGKLATDILAVAARGPLAASGRVRPVQFAAYMKGNNNGPIYILNRGLPSSVRVKVNPTIARALYDFAKATPVPESASEHRGRMLTAKISYSAPQIKRFSTSTQTTQMMFSSLHGGAAVEFETKAKALCIYDGSGRTPLYCADL